MAGECLGGAVHHDIGPRVQRPLQDRGGEGVVHDRAQASRAGSAEHGIEIGPLEQRIGGGFQPQQRGRLVDGGQDRSGVADIDKVEFDSSPIAQFSQARCHAGVGRGRCDDPATEWHQIQDCVGGAHAGREGDRLCRGREIDRLQLRHQLFEGGDRRPTFARVLDVATGNEGGGGNDRGVQRGIRGAGRSPSRHRERGLIYRVVPLAHALTVVVFRRSVTPGRYRAHHVGFDGGARVRWA